MLQPINDNDEGLLEDEPTALNIPQEVMKMIDEVVPTNDPLDDHQFNSIDYINNLFPNEQSLTNIDDVIVQLEGKIFSIDDQIRTVIRGQTNVGKNGRDALLDAQQIIRQLCIQTLEIKGKAEQAEDTVKEITRDIKQLDCAKRNLTSAVTTLNHLHMLLSGLDTLKALTGKRQYGDLVMPLQGLIEVTKHFRSYTDIPSIKRLSEEVNDIQTSLSKQITQDFHAAFTGSNTGSFTPTRSLAEACLVLNILDPKVKQELLSWFVDRQLNEYVVLFDESEDNAWLDKIDRRFTWFKKLLLQCEDTYGSMFPPHWEVSERITVKFCKTTKSELTRIMTKRLKEIDVKLLLYAIQRTASFEQLISARFTGNTLLEESGDSQQLSKERVAKKTMVGKIGSGGNPFIDQANSEDKEEAQNQSDSDSDKNHFVGIIGECFLPYLYIYIESIDRNLFELMEKLMLESKSDFSSCNQTGLAVQGVLPSCADLFVFYKKFLVQCNQLSNGSPMLSLAHIFKKYLKEYAVKILQNSLPKLGGNNGSSPRSISVTNITRDLRDISSATSLIQNFLKEDGVVQFSKADIARICCILTTAEYCLETTQQLEEKLKAKIESSLAEKVSFLQEQDIFHSLISNCIQLLAQDLEIACEPALIAMSKIQWQSLESVGDQSAYVTAITSHLKTSVPFIKESLSSSRKYFTQFCVKFANSFIPKFIGAIYKCKPLSTVGAEQLLLDTHMLKTVLLDLPSLGSQVARSAPASYTKVVVKGMTRGEMILKVVMAPTEPEKLFVDQYLKLLPDSDSNEFQKVLEMKGLKASDKNHLLSIFRPQINTSLVPASALSASPKHDSSSIRKLNNLIKKNFVAGSNE